MKKKFKLENLDCANCAAKIEEKVKHIDGVDNASVSFMMQKLVIEADESVMNGDGACRVHGGGFAGTAQVFVPADKEAAFVRAMECAFGAGCATKLMIRPMGAVKVY